MSLPVELTVVIARLKARLREEAGTDATGLSIGQLTILHRLRRDGASTAASLAAAEHVSQQAIAQSLAVLKDAGLVRAEPDPADGRKVLLSATERGRTLVTAITESRDAWLARAIDLTFDAAEQAELERAVELLGRLADAEVAAHA